MAVTVLLLQVGQLGLAACAGAASDNRPVTLRPLAPPAGGNRIGELRLKAAFEIAGGRGVGGLSAVTRQGNDLFLLSDRSRLFRARMQTSEAGDLQGLTEWREIALPKSLREADTEGLSPTQDGHLVLAAENRHDLVRLQDDGRMVERLPLPSALSDAPANEGIEAVAALPDGRYFVVTEGLTAGPERMAAVLLEGEGSRMLTVSAPNGFRPTDVAIAGDRLFILQRRLALLEGGLNSRLLTLPLAALEGSGNHLDGIEIARFDGRSFAENFEGLSAKEIEPDRYHLILVSDNEFSPLLRTLLLELEWQAPSG